MLPIVVLVLALLTVATAVAAAKPPTLPDVEDEVMCPTCGVPLNIAESPQADEERDFIRGLIRQGLSKDQIKQRLENEYGRNVLAMPRDHGFDLTATIVPVGVGLAVVAALAILLPRWRRRTRGTPAAPIASGPALSAADAARLDEDLRRYDP
jgi:cytochrome c-type biogenesis protein CcmH